MTSTTEPQLSPIDNDLSLAAGRGDLAKVCALLDQGADARARGSLALRKAVVMGHVDCVRLLIPVSEPTADDSAALCAATRARNFECVMLLAPLSNARVDDSAALRSASRHGHHECVKLLIPLSDPCARDSEALRWAAANGYVESVALLIPSSDPKALNSRALRAAAGSGRAESVRLLIPVSDPEAGDSDALQLAAASGDLECVKLLAPVSHIKKSNALNAAVRGGHAECVKLLLEAIASQGESFEPKEVFEPNPSHGVQASEDAPNSATNLKNFCSEALGIAAMMGYGECASLLIPASMPLATHPHPFHTAIDRGRANIVALMLSHEPELASLIADPAKLAAEAASHGRVEMAGLMLSIAEARVISSAIPTADSSPRSIRI